MTTVRVGVKAISGNKLPTNWSVREQTLQLVKANESLSYVRYNHVCTPVHTANVYTCTIYYFRVHFISCKDISKTDFIS